MRPPFRLRRAVPEDASALAALGRETFLETFAPLYDPADMAAFLEGAYTAARQRAELEDPTWVTLLAEQEDRPAGFAQLVRDAPVAGVSDPAPWELRRIYLLRWAQGTGLGDDLLRACRDLARAGGGGALWLGVWERNPRAIAFYLRHGFREVGEHTFMVGSRADRDLILSLDLRLPGTNDAGHQLSNRSAGREAP